MRDDIGYKTRVVLDLEVETPVLFTRPCQISFASSYFLAWSEGWLRLPARNLSCLCAAFCTAAGASAIALAARSDRTIVIATICAPPSCGCARGTEGAR